MQPNTITLAVDTANTGSTTDQDYARYAETINSSQYIGEDHSLSVRNTLQFYRTAAKKNGNFPGTAKSAVKFTQDVEIPGVDTSTTLVAPSIIEISFSLPVGATSAHAKELRQRALALLDDDAIIGALHELLSV